MERQGTIKGDSVMVVFFKVISSFIPDLKGNFHPEAR